MEQACTAIEEKKSMSLVAEEEAPPNGEPQSAVVLSMYPKIKASDDQLGV
jgi:hypothetical protein